MSRKPLSPELAGLLEELCLGDLSAERAARLEAILQADPEQCRHYVRFMQMHAIAERCEATSPAGDDIAPPIAQSPTRPVTPSSRRPVLGFLASISRHVPGGEFTVGSLLLLVIVAAFWGLSQAILFPKLGGHDLAEESSQLPTVPSSHHSENVAMVRELAGASTSEARHRAIELLDYLGVGHRKTAMPSTISGGEAQRVAIARALVTQPSILLADEPTGALDSHTGKEVMALFHELNDAGITVIVVTHDMTVASQSRRIITLRDGEVVSDEQ